MSSLCSLNKGMYWVGLPQYFAAIAGMVNISKKEGITSNWVSIPPKQYGLKLFVHMKNRFVLLAIEERGKKRICVSRFLSLLE